MMIATVWAGRNWEYGRTVVMTMLYLGDQGLQNV